jgi:hypothetical protein
MKNIKDDNGIISLFVLFILLFLLVFVLTIYSIVENKNKNEELKNIEFKEIYSENNADKVETYAYAESDDIIPIYNIREFNIAGTGNFVQIKNKIYQCSRNKQYLLKSNIIVDVEEDLKSVYIDFNDYKFYLSSFNIDKNIYDIYYYYKNDYWKVISYQKFSKKDTNKDFVKSGTYLENQFSILKEYNFKNSNLNFMILWSSTEGELNNIKIKSQNHIPNSLEDIEVFRENKSEINTVDGKFYIFVNIGNSI